MDTESICVWECQPKVERDSGFGDRLGLTRIKGVLVLGSVWREIFGVFGFGIFRVLVLEIREIGKWGSDWRG